MPRAINKEMLGGGKSSGLLARLRMRCSSTTMILITMLKHLKTLEII
jgi:hypothetical protein